MLKDLFAWTAKRCRAIWGNRLREVAIYIDRADAAKVNTVARFGDSKVANGLLRLAPPKCRIIGRNFYCKIISLC